MFESRLMIFKSDSCMIASNVWMCTGLCILSNIRESCGADAGLSERCIWLFVWLGCV